MKTAELRRMLKKNSLVFFTYKKLTDNLYRSNLIDYMLQEQVKPKHVIKEEMRLMRDYWKCDPMNYYRYRLYEKNMTLDELLDYIPPYYFYNYYVPSIYDESRIKEAASKILMNEYFKAREIDIPIETALVIRGKIFSEGNLTDYPAFIERLRKSPSSRFFMKPDNGKGGKGIFRIEKIGNEFFMNNEFLSHEYFQEIISQGNYIIQEGVIQRSDMMKLYPHSVNTLRVITQNFNGEPVISVATIRMGRNGTFVDNSASGGISAKVDPENGMVEKYAYDLDNNMKFDKHPDTGFTFEGFTISDWDHIKQKILEYAGKAVDFPDIGWDIAVVDNGIKVIEINLNYGIDLQAIVGGMRRLLNIVPFKSPKIITA